MYDIKNEKFVTLINNFELILNCISFALSIALYLPLYFFH